MAGVNRRWRALTSGGDEDFISILPDRDAPFLHQETSKVLGELVNLIGEDTDSSPHIRPDNDGSTFGMIGTIASLGIFIGCLIIIKNGSDISKGARSEPFANLGATSSGVPLVTRTMLNRSAAPNRL